MTCIKQDHMIRYISPESGIKPIMSDAALGVPRIGERVRLDRELSARTILGVDRYIPVVRVSSNKGSYYLVADVYLTALEPD